MNDQAEIHLPPSAAELLESMRALGYSFEAALADLIDNSLSADAHRVEVRFSPYEQPYVAVLDDGWGMTPVEITAAMRHGSRDPRLVRDACDLGRFGLGLKTASLSQCRRLTVATLKHGELSARRWDLDHVARRQDWMLLQLSEAQLLTLPVVDELRAQVQLQAQQQALISAQNEEEKDLILLKREIGIDPGQQIDLTDPAPSSDLTAKTREELLASAYKYRHDYLTLQSQAVELKAVHLAFRSRRLPTLSFQGYWGTATVNGAGTHGTMAAVGTLSLPLFREASLRGDIEASLAQLDAVNNELADLRERIDEQLRMALLDLEASRELVGVARSTVELSTRALSDETERVNAGIDDNLPLVTAQAALASAESNLVESLYQYNVAKLALAASAGVIESRYREYLGR